MIRMRLAIVTSHPIQYNAPLFRLLASREKLDVMVFYTWGQSKEAVFDPGFGVVRSWDIPLLEGYEYTFVKNTSTRPGSHHFFGIKNPTLISDMKRWDPHAILLYGWNFLSHLKLMVWAKRKGIPVLFRGDSTLLRESTNWNLRKIIRRVFLTWVYRHVDTALYVGAANRAYFTAHGLTERQLVLAHHAVDLKRFLERDSERSEAARKWRREIGVPEDKVLFLFAGKFEAVKNVVNLVEAFQQMPQVHLLLVGNGSLEEQLRRMAASTSHIHFLPFQNQSVMPVLYRVADVFILPSKSETWGLGLNEAMACGRPVIASTMCGAASDLIVEGVTGTITDLSTSGIQESVKRLLKWDLRQVGRQAEEHIRLFSFTRICESIENVVERLSQG